MKTHQQLPGNILPGQKLEEKHLVEALFHHASMGIIVANAAGEIILANPFVLQLFGYHEEEVLGHKVEMLIPSRFRERHVQHRDHFTAHLQNRPMGAGMDLFAVRKDGTEFPVEVSLCHYTNSKGSFVVAFINNISIRKAAEQEVRRLNDELENKVTERTQQLKDALIELEHSREGLNEALNKEKELNELKSRFVSMASHEFRTPLSTILSSTYLLQRYSAPEDEHKKEKHIDRIIAAVGLLTDILNDFLSLGKIEEGRIEVKPVSFNGKDLISLTIDEMKNITRDGQQIRCMHTGAGMVTMDMSLLKHIIINLLSNAIKFSPANAIIEVYSRVENNSFHLVVKDYGIGISKEDQLHLFERFFRGTNASHIQGTGLGLHIIARYTELMHGTITCRSEVGAGTEMHLVFDGVG